MPAKIATIAGTWGRSGLPAGTHVPPSRSGSYYWWKPPSVFTANLKAAGLELVSETDYFDWSTNLDGVKGPNSDWSTAGKALYWWWRAHGRQPLSVIGHSHAGQVVAYALTYGSWDAEPMRLEHLVTVGSPVREDVEALWERVAELNLVEDWTHLYADEKIVMPDDLGYQMIGAEPHSSSWEPTRLMRHATRNVEVVPAVTHHGLVWPQLWNDKNLWQYLK